MTEISPQPVRPSVIVALLVLAGTVVFMSLFFGLYKLLGVGAPSMGLLFLLYWAAMLHMDFSVYPRSIIGAVIGTLLAWMLITLPVMDGVRGTLVSYSALGIVLFCYTRTQATLFVNNGTLLFVLVATIPELQVTHNVVQMELSVLLAAAFMGIVAWLIQVVRSRRPDRQPTGNI